MNARHLEQKYNHLKFLFRNICSPLTLVFLLILINYRYYFYTITVPQWSYGQFLISLVVANTKVCLVVHRQNGGMQNKCFTVWYNIGMIVMMMMMITLKHICTIVGGI
jgi:hypothetical protein